MNTQATINKTPAYAYVIFFLAASFYLYEFILQVSPSVMADEMMETFSVGAGGFGIISSIYFYAYAPMQLPAGLLFDRYGPRKLMTSAALVCASGMIFFAATDSIYTAAIGRFLIGIGSACSFIGVLVLISRWFPANRFALFAGLAQMMSSLGAIAGEMPLAYLVGNYGWRLASFILAAIGGLIAILIWYFVSDYPVKPPNARSSKSYSRELLRLKEVCSKPLTWIIGAYACAIWTPVAVFAALWGVPYLQEKYAITVIQASGLCSMIWIGIGIGSPVLGWVSDKLQDRRSVLMVASTCGLLSTLALLYLPFVSIGAMMCILFVFGIGAGGQSLSFAVVKDSNPGTLVGTASGFNNLSVLIGGAIFQPFVGIMLQKSGLTHAVHGKPMYYIEAYQWALLVMPISYLAALIICMCGIKKSYHTKINSN